MSSVYQRDDEKTSMAFLGNRQETIRASFRFGLLKSFRLSGILFANIGFNRENQHMGFFDFLKANDINNEIANRRDNSVLLDVREADEYKSGHIPGAENFPLSTLNQAELPWDKSTELLVYCLAGTRSRRAVSFLQSQGFSNVKNIGGIKSYQGILEN